MPCPPNKVIQRTPAPTQRSTYCAQRPDLPAQSSGHLVFIYVSSGGRGGAEEAGQREDGGWGVREVGSEASSGPVCPSFLPGFPRGLCLQAPGMKGQVWPRAQSFSSLPYPCRRKFHSPASSYAGCPRQTSDVRLTQTLSPPIPARFHIRARPPSTCQQASRTAVFTHPASVPLSVARA